VLDWWEDAGVDVPDVKLAAPKRKVPPRQAPAQKTMPSQTPRPKPAAPKPMIDAAPIAAKAKTLTELKAAMDTFDAGPLSDGARQCVFARGNPDANVMVIGEAPGIEEDKAGKPFIGPAGQLLDKMLASIGLTEETAYLTNVVNWRLPNNRKTTDDDIALCKPFLDCRAESYSDGGRRLHVSVNGPDGDNETTRSMADRDDSGERHPSAPDLSSSIFVAAADIEEGCVAGFAGA